MFKMRTKARLLAAVLAMLIAGGLLPAQASPAGAATPPNAVSFHVKNREVDLVSSFATCHNIRWNPTSTLTVPYGAVTQQLHGLFTCSNNGRSIVAELWTAGFYHVDRRAVLYHAFRVKVEGPQGTVTCTPDFTRRSELSRTVTQEMSFWWSALRVHFYGSPGDTRALDCGPYGTVRAGAILTEGMSAA